MAKDWTGNKTSVFKTLGASSHSEMERAENDFYATDPKAVKELLKKETFNKNIWECACGEGHISKVLESHGYNVRSTDLIDRGYGEVQDFLISNEIFPGDIITNPPYRYAKEFVEKSLDSIKPGNKVAMFFRIQFLEGKSRRELFDRNPPIRIYVPSGRINCSKNGDFEHYNGGAVCYAWFIWEKGYKGLPVLDWIN